MGWSQKVLRQIGIWWALIMKLKKKTKIYLIFLLGGWNENSVKLRFFKNVTFALFSKCFIFEG